DKMSVEQYQKNLARFLALALLQYGKPYDFKFDVNTLDAIVCSELIYQSFVDVDFSTGKSLGSYTVSPDQVAQAAGIKTALDTLKLDPPFDLVQWYLEAMPLYPPPISPAESQSSAAIDSLVIRSFMAMVREEYGGLKLLSPAERQQLENLQEQAKRARNQESERLRQAPAATMTATRPKLDRASERRLQNFYIELNRKIEQARAEGQLEAAIVDLQEQETEAFAASATEERATALAENFQRWQQGAAYRPSYVDLYSGGERFFLSVFRSARATDDDGFGRGLDLQFAGNNESPQVSLIYTQHYSFLPFHLQFFNKSGKIHKAIQGGAALARISRRYTQGDYVEMEAISWRNNAYTTALLPFSLEAGGDKGPLDAILQLMTIGNGHYHRGLYIGEIGRVELTPFEIRNSRRAFTLANLFYGARAQITVGDFRLYATGKVGARLGEFAERKRQKPSTDFPPIRSWIFGLELFGSTLYRPTSHCLEFEVIEDDARFM
ncbi:MAG: YiiX/YebB-like N1pC/P60 family cysteine hydrolase, partial [bacterium]